MIEVLFLTVGLVFNDFNWIVTDLGAFGYKKKGYYDRHGLFSSDTS